ncbi:armadillo-like helical domain-containing protein 4 isoform X2 [Scyliorhinus canicula]|uniref:armadillo-like helical domain-containing protein 4 isoform X2 n=1 Tax=Scyliorhinus canicula TaxID=7830 RepID=UPI0018F62B08|nr:armadillo-like helical domain-containing protein 4 isoform X2 [Scyliorhinus canicula]
MMKSISASTWVNVAPRVESRPDFFVQPSSGEFLTFLTYLLMMRPTKFHACVAILATLICLPGLRSSVIQKRQRRNIRIFEVSTAKPEGITSYNENNNGVKSDTVLNGETASFTASSNILRPSLETLTAAINPSIAHVEETKQTNKAENENVITITSLDILPTTTTMVPSQKPFSASTKDADWNKTVHSKQKDSVTVLATKSSSNPGPDASEVNNIVYMTTGATPNDAATVDQEKTEGTMKNKKPVPVPVTISSVLGGTTKSESSGVTLGPTDSSSENFTLNSHDTTALPLTSKTILTVNTTQKDVNVLTAEMLNFSEFTSANVESFRNEEVTTTTIISEPEGNYFSWKVNSPNTDKEMNEIMATTVGAVTDSKAPSTFQVTTTPRVTTSVKGAAMTESVSSASTETMLKTTQTTQVFSTAAITESTKEPYKGLSSMLAVTNGIPAVRSALPTTHLPEKQVSEAVNTTSTKEMGSMTPTEMMLPPAEAASTIISQAVTSDTSTRQTISRKTKKTSTVESDVTDRMTLLLLTTIAPSVEPTEPPSNTAEQLESEAMTNATDLPQQKSVVPVGKNTFATTAAPSAETNHTALQASATKKMEMTMVKPSIATPVLRDNTWPSLTATMAPSLSDTEPPTYMLDTTESEEEDDEDDEDDEEGEEDDESDSDEDSMDYDTEVPSLPYITPDGRIRDNRNLTKVMEMSYQLPDSFQWNQHDQVRSWLEKIKDKAGYMSGMLVPVAVGVAGALFILGALYSFKVMNRKRKNVFKRREAKPKDFTSMQDRVMLLADSSEDEF